MCDSFDSGSSHDRGSSCSHDSHSSSPDSGGNCSSTETPMHPGMDDLMLYGMTASILTFDPDNGDVRSEMIRPQYLNMNTDVQDRGPEPRHEIERRNSDYYANLRYSIEIENKPGEIIYAEDVPHYGYDPEWEFCKGLFVGMFVVGFAWLIWAWI